MFQSSPDHFYLYESLFANDDYFLNQNNERTNNEPNHLKLIWEVNIELDDRIDAA